MRVAVSNYEISNQLKRELFEFFTRFTLSLEDIYVHIYNPTEY